MYNVLYQSVCSIPIIYMMSEDNISDTKEAFTTNPLVGSYWLVRVIFIRCLAFLYAIAFLVAYNQNESLIGYLYTIPYSCSSYTFL